MNSIIRKDYVHIRDEKVAAATITPGMLVERTSADKVQAHSTAGGPVNALFAIEDAPQGKDKDDNYSADNPVLLWHPVPGEQVLAIASEAIAVGEFLESAGTGKLRPASQGSAGGVISVVAVALEAAAALDDRLTVEIV